MEAAIATTAPLACSPALAKALPVGLSVCPLSPAQPPPELLWRGALRCAKCLAYINQFCSVADGAWKCALCGAHNPAASLTASSAPELAHAVVEYPEPFAQPRLRAEVARKRGSAVGWGGMSSKNRQAPRVRSF